MSISFSASPYSFGYTKPNFGSLHVTASDDNFSLTVKTIQKTGRNTELQDEEELQTTYINITEDEYEGLPQNSPKADRVFKNQARLFEKFAIRLQKTFQAMNPIEKNASIEELNAEIKQSLTKEAKAALKSAITNMAIRRGNQLPNNGDIKLKELVNNGQYLYDEERFELTILPPKASISNKISARLRSFTLSF